ncbi:hypothetical protein [Pseudomonas frederiksbergensis]|nr:hypothetical protein [Pseudomonas frederiksbergensis]
MATVRNNRCAGVYDERPITLEVGDSELGGAQLVLDCRQSLVPQA